MIGEEIDAVVYMQVNVASELMARWGNSKFWDLDARYELLEYIKLCYEPFHLTGIEGIIEEIEDWVRLRGGRL